MFTRKDERHVEARAIALDWLRTYDALLKYDNYRPGKLTDEESAELAYERSIKHMPQRRKHPYA